MNGEREEVGRAVESMLNVAQQRGLEAERRRCNREWDVSQATAALKAVSGLCTVFNAEARDESLDGVGRSDLAALLSLISERLERSVQAAL